MSSSELLFALVFTTATTGTQILNWEVATKKKKKSSNYPATEVLIVLHGQTSEILNRKSAI